MRAFWTGDIVFGLVQIPVKIYSATKDLSPTFHQLHKTCGSRVNMVRRCASCNLDLDWDDIGKGYEVSKEKYALFSKEELANLEGGEETKGTVEIVQFIDPSEVDPASFDKSYLVGPGGKNPKQARGYELLRTVLADTGRAALINIKFRTKPRIGIVRAKGRIFALETMRYADELVNASELALPDVKSISEREREMAESLIDELTAPFDASKQVDEYRAKVVAAADAKIAAGQGVEVEGAAEAPQEKRSGVVVDLADLLAASLGKKSASSNKKKPASGEQ